MRRRAPMAVFRGGDHLWICDDRAAGWYCGVPHATWREAFDHAYARAKAKWPWWM